MNIERWVSWGFLVCLALASVPLQAQETSGRVVDWGERLRVSTPLTGTIAESACEEGRYLQAGALLYRLEDRPWRAELTAAESALRHARLLLEEAQREMERVEALYDDGLIAEHERQQARIALAQAQQAADQAEAQRAMAEQRLGWTQIRLPVAGEVLSCLAHRGEMVNGAWSAAILAEVAVGRQREVALEVPRTVALGQSVEVRSRGRRYPGRVVRVAPASREGRLAVRIRFQPDEPLPLGEEVSVQW